MTGEIDTQGRISMIGGLELKLEIAYDAGSRTMIIPKENLYGDGGIERLSEALKRELQVLSYEAWKGPHDSFDYSRHLMQVVGVDRITQAAEIAFIDDEELDQIETCLIPHARSVAEALAANRHASRPPFRALYVKDVKELEQDGSQGSLWENGPCVFLVQTRSEEAIRGEFPILEERKRLWGFDPAFHDVTAVLREMAEAFGDRSGSLVPSSLVAPFFFLYREKERLDGFSPGPSFEQLRLFANNFTVQEVKFRACKAVLNRVYYYLSLLDSRQLDACPFLGKRDGIYVVDMSFIPEKYRLDLKRAEELLIVSLKRWLMTLESSSSASETQISTSLG
jgi:ATP-dependent Lon protease